MVLCSCSLKEESQLDPSKPKTETEQVNPPAGSPGIETRRLEGRTTAGGGKLVPIPLVLPRPVPRGHVFDELPDEVVERSRGKARPPFLAPKGVTNVALGKPVTSSVAKPIIGQLSMITDGKKEAWDDSGLVKLDYGPQHVTIDLKPPCEIYAIVVWHFHKRGRVFFHVVVQVADDPSFTRDVRTLFNNDSDNGSGCGVGTDRLYLETYEGKLIDAKGATARYVRLYSRGSNSGDSNYYLEVEVYGRPAK